MVQTLSLFDRLILVPLGVICITKWIAARLWRQSVDQISEDYRGGGGIDLVASVGGGAFGPEA